MRTYSIVISPFRGRLTPAQERDYPESEAETSKVDEDISMRKYLIGKSFKNNVVYAKRALLDSIHRGEYPFASHLLYPLVLNDDTDAERELGMELERRWIDAALSAADDRGSQSLLSLQLIAAVYFDRGMTKGMIDTVNYMTGHVLFPDKEVHIQFRSIGDEDV